MNKKLTVVKNNNTMVNFCESNRIICKSDVNISMSKKRNGG